jgi:hypothetical protein
MMGIFYHNFLEMSRVNTKILYNAIDNTISLCYNIKYQRKLEYFATTLTNLDLKEL